MADLHLDDLQPVRTDDLRALADLGVNHAHRDHAIAVVERRLAENRATPAPRARRWWSSPRPLAIALVGTVLTGSVATAATLSLIGSPSEPLEGALPAAQRSDWVVQSSRYRVALFPTLAIGESGWCLTQETTNQDGTPGSGGSTCGSAATRSTSIITAMSGSVDPSRPKAQLIESIVDARVAGLRLHDGSIVTARADPALPDGWRSLIAFQDVARKSRYLGPNGRAAPSAYAPPEFDEPDAQPSRTTDPSAPDRTCSIRSASSQRTKVTSARELVRDPQAIAGLNGRPFLSCATARITHAGALYTAAVLVDAAAPGHDPARLPGSTPHDGPVVTVPGNAFRPTTIARRSGHAWLLVQGEAADGRNAVLDDLTAKR